MFIKQWAACVGAMVIGCAASTTYATQYFAIHVVDAATGRGVPLVELRTTYNTCYYTDSNGYVAFYEPGLMHSKVWFDVRSWGYQSPAGVLGTHGVALDVAPGKSAQIKLKRINIAERLYRMTGYGIYRDTVMLGMTPPITQGLLNAQVVGQDSVLTAVYRGKMYWMWGDTGGIGVPLGNFHTTGATSAPPEGLDPDKGIDLTYFVTKPGSFVRSMVEVPKKTSLPIWLGGLVVVKDDHGREHMLARYVIVNRDMTPNESGLALYNDEKQVFEPYKQIANDDPLGPGGRPLRARDGGEGYLYFSTPYVTVRVKDDFASATDPVNYEGFTCLKPGGVYAKLNPPLNRDPAGKLLWTWQRGAGPISPQQVDEMVKAKLIRREETPFQLRDTATGKGIAAASGSVAWNPYLKKWTLVFCQFFGDTLVGETWFATANAPEGPSRDAKKVATHAMKNANNDLYNVIQNQELMRDNGRFVYFEGTFVNTFEGNPIPTPYYNYNNVMYRLDLSDPRLKLSEPPPGLSDAQPE